MKKNNNTAYINLIISFVAVVVVLLSLVLIIQNDSQVKSVDKQKAVTFAPARTPSGLTYTSERIDIVKWAEAQVNYSTQGNGSPISAYHDYYGWTNEPWCQLFINWCGAMVGVRSDLFNQTYFNCQGAYDFHGNIGGNYRKSSTTDGIEEGWLLYETYPESSKYPAPSHVGIYVGGGAWVHGNYNDYYVQRVTTNWGELVGYAKPYYRSKVKYIAKYGNFPNGRVKGAAEFEEYYIEEQPYTLVTDVSNDNHKFLGWYRNTSASGTAWTNIPTYERGPFTFYAGWKKLESPINYVTYGGKINDASYITKYVEGETPALPMNVARDGCTFVGWSLNDPPTGNTYSKVQAGWTGEKTLYAKYQANITYEPNRGVFASGYTAPSIYYPRISTFALPQPPNFTRDYCDFYGWYANSTLTTGPYLVVKNNDVSPWNKDIKLYARWIGKKYEIRLHTRGGTVDDNRFSLDSGRNIYVHQYQYVDNIAPIQLPTEDKVNKSNYAFDGWYASADFSTSPSTETEYDKGGDYDFYARWVNAVPNTDNSDHVETVNGVTNVYVYSASREYLNNSELMWRDLVPIAEQKRYFDIDLRVLGYTTSTVANDVRIFVSESTDSSQIARRMNWVMTSFKNLPMSKGGAMYYTTKDINTIRVKLPSNVEDFIGDKGSKKIYFHVVTESGTSMCIPINLVNRTVYGLH